MYKRFIIVCWIMLAISFALRAQNINGVVTTHPRLWITQNDLPRLRSWASNTNPMYVNGMLPALNTAINIYNTKFFPNGTANPSWPDGGTTNWEAYDTEAYAEFFAFNSLIDPSSEKRITYAQMARNLLMYIINEASKGVLANAPYRDPMYPLYNRANYWGEAYGLTVDWIYNAVDANGNPILTAQDKQKIRDVFLIWAGECVNYDLSGADHPHPVGVTNNSSLLASFRIAGNNYFAGHMRTLTMMALSIDSTDDQPVNPGIPSSTLGNTLRSYINNAIGAWLYQQYALYETASIVTTEYGLTSATKDMGLASGGIPPEGSMYGFSLGYFSEALLSLYTAGYTDPKVFGPQIKMINSDYWNKFIDGNIHSLTPKSYVNSTESYLGSIYSMASFGDMLRAWITPDYIFAFGPIGIYDYQNNNQQRLSKIRWFTENVLQGGSAKLYERCSDVWGNSQSTYSILYFMLFDPSASKASDPRPSMPTTFFDPALNRILSRTSWGDNSSWFDYMCHWTSIYHQLGDGGEFEFFRNNEWLIKETSGYGLSDFAGGTGEFHNTIGIQNTVPANLQWYETEISARGGQWMEGINAGDPVNISSFGQNYIYAFSNMTNLYNRPNQWTPADAAIDVLHASRSIIWLKPDQIVVYDRATSKSSNMFKRFFLDFCALPVVNGQTAVASYPSGQKLYLNSLFPINGTLTVNPNLSYNAVAELQPATNSIKIEDPSNPANIRFLNVLQAADGNAAINTPTLVQSTSGPAFDGAVIGQTALLFPVNTTFTFSNIVYSVPTTVAEQYITGLSPNTSYDAVKISAGNKNQYTISLGSTYKTDASGLLYFKDQTITAISNSNGIPTSFSLEQNYPNPFNPSTIINYKIAKTSNVLIKVYDLLGRDVATLVNEEKPAGTYNVKFDASHLTCGVYIYRIAAGDYSATKKMIYLK